MQKQSFIIGLVIIVGVGLVFLSRSLHKTQSTPQTESEQRISIPFDGESPLDNPQADAVQNPGLFSGQEDGSNGVQNSAIVNHQDLENIEIK